MKRTTNANGDPVLTGYERITFTQDGKRRRRYVHKGVRTVGTAGPFEGMRMVMFRAVTPSDPRAVGEVIVVSEDDVRRRPVVLNLKYAEFEPA